jgi:RNA polymerase sigma-70 factor (ECF subfamily)
MTESAPDGPPEVPATADLESTATLLERIRRGDEAAEELLLARHLPAMRRWATGRLPSYARHLADTDDIVQVTLIRTLRKVKDFKSEHRGAFFAYLRRALQNQIRDQLRAAGRRPKQTLPAEPVASEASPLEEAIGRERLEAYERGLQKLEERQREAVIMRVELGMTYEEIAEVIGSPSWNAARMLISRALVKLSREMHVD